MPFMISRLSEPLGPLTTNDFFRQILPRHLLAELSAI